MLIFQDLETSTQSARIRTGVNEMMTRFATRDIDTLLAEMRGLEKRVLVLLSIGSLAALRESSGAMGCSGAWGGGGLWRRRGRCDAILRQGQTVPTASRSGHRKEDGC